MNRAIALALVILSPLLLAQTPKNQIRPNRVFDRVVKEILRKTTVPILLPSNVPFSADDIKFAWGDASESSWSIALHYDEVGTDSSYAAGFGGTTHFSSFSSHDRRVLLSNGITAIFWPVRCGKSFCAPASLWWVQNGVEYNIQIKLGSDMRVPEQEKILVEVANSMVPVRG
jgi:hypothetical protein